MKDCVSPTGAGASADALDGKMVWNKLFDWKKEREAGTPFYGCFGQRQVPGGGVFLIGKMRGAKTLPEC